MVPQCYHRAYLQTRTKSGYSLQTSAGTCVPLLTAHRRNRNCSSQPWFSSTWAWVIKKKTKKLILLEMTAPHIVALGASSAQEPGLPELVHAVLPEQQIQTIQMNVRGLTHIIQEYPGSWPMTFQFQANFIIFSEGVDSILDSCQRAKDNSTGRVTAIVSS